MAEEEETSAGVGLLSRLFGSLGLWRPAGDTETETATEKTEETETEMEETVAETKAGVEQHTVPGTAESESESRLESSRPESESIAARRNDSPTDRLDSDADGDNPHNIFGLHTAAKPKPSPPAEPLRPAKGKGSKRKTKGRQPGGRDGGATEPRRPAKKPPMRTARDVISRIQWDRNLPEDYFDIGYLDRFLGVVEKPFASFTWGDLPWQEYDVLAIPQHRIQYFSYRGVKVWEKSERFDAVFGSAGTTEVIEEAMTRIDAQVEARREAEAEARMAGTWQAGRQGGDEGEEGVFSDDSDGDDGVCVEVPAVVPAGVQGIPEEERSTHFLAVRVTSPAVRAGAARVQNSVVQHDVSLSACTMRQELLHITMCMMRLEDGEAITAAGRCLRETISELRETLRGDDRALRMRGLRTFGARVLYSPVAPCVSFCTAVELLRTRLDALPGVRLTNAFDYVPHLTLLKVSRPVARARRSKFIDAAGYAGMERDELGEQRFDNIHLCAIDADCALDGFYVTEASVTF